MRSRRCNEWTCAANAAQPATFRARAPRDFSDVMIEPDFSFNVEPRLLTTAMIVSDAGGDHPISITAAPDSSAGKRRMIGMDSPEFVTRNAGEICNRELSGSLWGTGPCVNSEPIAANKASRRDLHPATTPGSICVSSSARCGRRPCRRATRRSISGHRPSAPRASASA